MLQSSVMQYKVIGLFHYLESSVFRQPHEITSNFSLSISIYFSLIAESKLATQIQSIVVELDFRGQDSKSIILNFILKLRR